MSALIDSPNRLRIDSTRHSEQCPKKSELVPGTMVGQYRVTGLLGRGGGGAVYAASQPEIDAQVAIKVLEASKASDALMQRFVGEARAVNRIRHPNIIDVFAFGNLGDGRPYFVMEYLEGETLAERLSRGPMWGEARPLLLQICHAIEAAHREGVVHRDLKPENIWIARPKYDAPYVKVLDFGVAKLLETSGQQSVTEQGVALGTPHYMSPEQCRGESVGPRSDLYALGVLLYRVFCGCLPFQGANALSVMNQHITASPPPPSTHGPMPKALETLILRCLSKDPEARPASAAAVARELARVLDDDALTDTLQGGRKVPAQDSRDGQEDVGASPSRSRWRFAVFTAALVLAVSMAGWFWSHRNPAKPDVVRDAALSVGTASSPAPRPEPSPSDDSSPEPPTAADSKAPAASDPSPAREPSPRGRRILTVESKMQDSPPVLRENPFR